MADIDNRKMINIGADNPDFSHTVTSPLAASGSPMGLACFLRMRCSWVGQLPPLQVALFIEMQPQRFLTGRSKVAFLISLLNRQSSVVGPSYMEC